VIKGPRLRGLTLPNSNVPELLRADGVIEAQTRMVVEMSDGPIILLDSEGLWWMSKEAALALAALAAKGGKPDQLMVDATDLKAHRTAASLLKKGMFPDVSATPKAG